MTLSKKSKAAVLAAVLAGGWAIHACSPVFGDSVLEDRKERLLGKLPGPTAQSLAHLVPRAADKLTPVESETEDETRDHAESAGLTAHDIQTLKNIRELEDGESALRIGATLPLAVRQYAAGAVDFHRNRIPQAATHFEAVLTLPATERKSRELWAAFMLGRIAGTRGETAAAIRWFERTRVMATQGTPDPLGLAVASLGEEARVYWNSDQPTTAVKFYAQQAAYGSNSGIASLVTVARRMLADEKMQSGTSTTSRIARRPRSIVIPLLKLVIGGTAKSRGRRLFSMRRLLHATTGWRSSAMNCRLILRYTMETSATMPARRTPIPRAPIPTSAES